MAAIKSYTPFSSLAPRCGWSAQLPEDPNRPARLPVRRAVTGGLHGIGPVTRGSAAPRPGIFAAARPAAPGAMGAAQGVAIGPAAMAGLSGAAAGLGLVMNGRLVRDSARSFVALRSHRREVVAEHKAIKEALRSQVLDAHVGAALKARRKAVGTYHRRVTTGMGEQLFHMGTGSFSTAASAATGIGAAHMMGAALGAGTLVGASTFAGFAGGLACVPIIHGTVMGGKSWLETVRTWTTPSLSAEQGYYAQAYNKHMATRRKIEVMKSCVWTAYTGLNVVAFGALVGTTLATGGGGFPLLMMAATIPGVVATIGTVVACKVAHARSGRRYGGRHLDAGFLAAMPRRQQLFGHLALERQALQTMLKNIAGAAVPPAKGPLKRRLQGLRRFLPPRMRLHLLYRRASRASERCAPHYQKMMQAWTEQEIRYLQAKAHQQDEQLQKMPRMAAFDRLTQHDARALAQTETRLHCMRRLQEDMQALGEDAVSSNKEAWDRLRIHWLLTHGFAKGKTAAKAEERLWRKQARGKLDVTFAKVMIKGTTGAVQDDFLSLFQLESALQKRQRPRRWRVPRAA